MQAITMYTTNRCPFCVRAKKYLQKYNVDTINEIHIDEQPEQRDVMMQRTGRRTVPQIYIGETHVGGYDDLVVLDQKGGLEPLLQGNPSA